MSATLSASESLVYAGVTETPQTAIDVRDALGFPRSTTARQNVEIALHRLIAFGLVVRDTSGGHVTYRRPAQALTSGRRESVQPGDTVNTAPLTDSEALDLLTDLTRRGWALSNREVRDILARTGRDAKEA